MTDASVLPASRPQNVNFAVYTVGELASGIYTVIPAVLLMFYMTNILGIPVSLATLAAFVPRIVELTSNWIIPGISDRTRTRIGRRRPFMLAGSLTILPAFAAIWFSPFSDPVKSAYYVLGVYSICTLAYSCYVIPFIALNADLPRDYHDRTRLNSFRTAYVFIGMIVAGVGAPLIVDSIGGGRTGYCYMGIIMGAVMALAISVSFTTAREPPTLNSIAAPSIRETLSAIRGNRPYLLLLAAYFTYISSAGLFGTILAYFVTYVLGRNESFLSLIFLVMYVTSVACVPAWNSLSRRWGKLASFQVCIALVVASSVLYLGMNPHTPLPVIMAAVMLFGANAAGVQVFSFSMLADCIHHGNDDLGAKTSPAMFSGVFLAGEKLGFAAGALLAGSVLGVTGFVATTNGSVAQPPGAIEGMRLSLGLAPIVLNAIALIALRFYRPFERQMLERQRAK
jgi:GPH family glycoside/pentoside/hexuronide:cation symporter